MPVEARAYLRPLPNPEWLGKLTKEIIEPDLPIVDPHHHLWDHPGSRYLLDELLTDVNPGHNIVATMFIECGSGYRTSGPEEMRPIGESELVRAIAEESARRGGKTKICAGIVSFADLRLPNVDAVLEGLRPLLPPTAVIHTIEIRSSDSTHCGPSTPRPDFAPRSNAERLWMTQS
jgi:L-fuconolactonase